MQEKLELKLEELKELIEKDSIYQEAKALREKLLQDKSFIEQIRNLKSMKDFYSIEYRTKKSELYENQDYQKYQELENEIYLMVLEINQVLNQLTGKGVCQK